jgi:putative phage-type endonuclease
MITHELIQGSPEWLAYRANHFNASDAPAMMGESIYKTRTRLMHEMHTGISAEIDDATQSLFNDGHRFEASARPLAEKLIGDDLYPVTGSNGKFSASFDGLTMDDSTAFEHKSLNDELHTLMVDGFDGADLPLMYRIQMEQQCLVSGADRVLFMASKWSGDELVEERHCWYNSNGFLRAEIIAGWEQFEKDLAEYTPVEVIAPVVATPTKDLPALSIQVNGSISLISNLDRFGVMLNEFIKGINQKPNDDQGFADADAACKTLQKAQDALEAAEANALTQTSSIDDMRRTVKLYTDTARVTRLALEKVVKARKESIRVEIVTEGKLKFADHIAALNMRLGKPYMPVVAADFGGVIKSLRTIASVRNAVDTELARVKIESNAIADKIDINLKCLHEQVKDHAFLFADTGVIVMKENADLILLVKSRIDDHTKAEAEKADALRAQTQKEEEVKATAKAAKAAKDAQDKADEEARVKAQAEEIAFMRKELEAQRIANQIAAKEAADKAAAAWQAERVAQEAELAAERAEAARLQAIEDERRRINDLDIERQQAAVRAEYAEIEKKMVIERAEIAEAQARIDAHNAAAAKVEEHRRAVAERTAALQREADHPSQYETSLIPDSQKVTCEYCDGTGDVHGIDGEWRGRCYACDALAKPVRLRKPMKQTDEAPPVLINLGRINAILNGPTVSSEFLAAKGFIAIQQKNAKMYRQSDVGAICGAIVWHIQAVILENKS